jgi:hypothetical protein
VLTPLKDGSNPSQQYPEDTLTIEHLVFCYTKEQSRMAIVPEESELVTSTYIVLNHARSL